MSHFLDDPRFRSVSSLFQRLAIRVLSLAVPANGNGLLNSASTFPVASRALLLFAAGWPIHRDTPCERNARPTNIGKPS
jgi:hypothetical protein